jgi:hypothetical protein
MELVSMIFLEIDLETLTLFRSICRGARAVISNLVEYKTIITHAPGALRAALSIYTAE